MTTFQTFMEKVKKNMSEYCGATCKIQFDEIRKNNGMVYHGITIIEEGKNISPTIYIDELYEKYTEGMTFSGVMERVIRIYEEHKVNQNIDMGFLTDFSWVKEHIVYKLIGYEQNQELLLETPHVRFLDMAVVFYCSIMHDCLGSVTVLVKNGLCNLWKVDEKELLLLAEKNTPRIFPVHILDMKELIEPEKDFFERGDLGMYVLTNTQKQFGAACMRYPHIMRQLSQKISTNFFILPSSVHEVILVSERTDMQVEDYKRMVQEINRTHVAWEEVLTDSVYYYDREKETIVRL